MGEDHTMSISKTQMLAVLLLLAGAHATDLSTNEQLELAHAEIAALRQEVESLRSENWGLRAQLERAYTYENTDKLLMEKLEHDVVDYSAPAKASAPAKESAAADDNDDDDERAEVEERNRDAKKRKRKAWQSCARK